MKNNPFSSKFKSQKGAQRGSLIATYVILSILALIWLIPIVWIVLSAFRVQYTEGTFDGGMSSDYFPSGIGFKNFVDLFNMTYNNVDHAFLRWVGNTMLISVCCCLISSFLVLSVAYCMSKLKFKMRKAFMNLTMILGLFPGFMSMIAIYFLLKSIGLIANEEAPQLAIVGIIIAYSAGSGLGYQVAKGFFDVIPNSLVESAKLDGCSNFKIFLKIILPLSKPIIIYTALMAFTGPWMDFIFAKVIIGPTNVEYWTVSVGLYDMMFGTFSSISLFTKFAAGCVVIGVPIVALFMFLQKYYVEGVTAGAVKG